MILLHTPNGGGFHTDLNVSLAQLVQSTTLTG